METGEKRGLRRTETATAVESVTLRSGGPFSLAEAARFGFGQRHEEEFDGTMRLAFCVDGFAAQAGVAVTQTTAGVVRAEIVGVTAEHERLAIGAQVARVLSLDHDASGFVALGDADPVIGRLLAAAPGLRPPLFHSPYEAALWSVLSARRSWRTADGWRRRLSEGAGAIFEIAGRKAFAVPLPERLVELGVDGCRRTCGIEVSRAERVVGVAQAAADGLLDAGALAAMDLDAARNRLRTIKGIGPFYADLILIRAVGLTDVLPSGEPRVLAEVGELYGYGRAATQQEFEERAAEWTPWRTWVTVLIRAAGPRVRAATDATTPPADVAARHAGASA